MSSYAKIIKEHSLISKITLKGQKKTIKSISKKSMIFSEFSPSNIVKLENVGPTFSIFRPLLSYSYVATAVVSNVRD